MIVKPKLILNKFTGMNGGNGMYYLDGFSVEKENGMTSLDENYLVQERVNSSTEGYENIGYIMSMLYVYPLDGSTITAPQGYTLMMNSGSHFYLYDLYHSAYRGDVGGISSGSGGYSACQNPDMALLPSGNIIYTSANHLGLMIRGLAITGSSTTKIVASGINFVEMGMTTSDPNNRVTNLKTGKIYTITSISTTNTTNDTLNFSAIGTSTNNVGDEFIALVNTKFNLMDTGVYPAFIGQPISTYWARPIRQYGDTWYIGNGNYLAKLGTDETSFEAKFKQLPSGYQCHAIEVNGSDILISAVANNGSSHILMWDGFSDGWNTDVLVSRAPSALKAYKLGWVYLADGVIYYTDGRSTEELVSFPDDKNLEQTSNPRAHNGIAIVGDTMYFAVHNPNYNRGQNGVLVFNPKTGLSFFKAKGRGRAFNEVYCVYNFPQTRIDGLYSTNNNIELGCEYSYCNLRTFYSSSYSYDNKSFVYMIDFQEETQIKQIWLNLKRTSKVYSEYDKNQCKITVSAGNGNFGIIKWGQVSSIPTTTTINNIGGNMRPLEVGDEIEFVSGDVAGQRTFVTSITNGGTTSETATIDPPLSTTSSGSSNMRIWKVKKFETKVISETELSKPIVFNGNFLGSKMYLEVVVTGISNSFPVSIQDILLF